MPSEWPQLQWVLCPLRPIPQCRTPSIFVTVSAWNQPTFHPQESCQATQTRPCLAARTSGASSYCKRPFSSNGLRVSELTLFLALASANSHPLGLSFFIKHIKFKQVKMLSFICLCLKRPTKLVCSFDTTDHNVPGWGPSCPCAAAHTHVLLSAIPEHDQLPRSCPLL